MTEMIAAILDGNPVFRALDQDLVPRNLVGLNRDFPLLPGLDASLFAVPGKVPLFMEGEDAMIGVESQHVIGVALAAGGRRAFYIPGCAHLTESLTNRIRGADIVFFDGTLFTDDEMMLTRTGTKTGRRMGHMPTSGEGGSLENLARLNIGRTIYIQSTTPIPFGGTAQSATLFGDMAAPRFPLLPVPDKSAFEARLRAIGDERYHDKHPFHRMLHGGRCTMTQVRAWVINRYYYQSRIPMKDAAFMSGVDDPGLRRAWRRRMEDHDGGLNEGGGLRRWLKLAEAVGLNPDYVASTDGILPGTRFAVAR